MKMNILALKCDQPEVKISLYRDGQLVKDTSWLADRSLAKNLNKKIDEILQNNNSSIDQLSGLIFFKGPGSFTGLRIGAAVFNTMAYSLNIPIVGETGDSWLTNGLKNLEDGKNEKIILPFYGSEAHITQAKK